MPGIEHSRRCRAGESPAASGSSREATEATARSARRRAPSRPQRCHCQSVTSSTRCGDGGDPHARPAPGPGAGSPASRSSSRQTRLRLDGGHLLLEDGGDERVPRAAGAAQPQPPRRAGAGRRPPGGRPGRSRRAGRRRPASRAPPRRPARRPDPRRRSAPSPADDGDPHRRRPVGRRRRAPERRRRPTRIVGSPVPRRCGPARAAGPAASPASRRTRGPTAAAMAVLRTFPRVVRSGAGQRGAMRRAPSMRMTSPLR